MLSFTRHSSESAIRHKPLVIVHGLYGSGRNWGVISRRLADTREVIAVDMRNHGHSPRFPTNSYPDMAGDLAEVIHEIGAPADVLGHSMGGKAAMVLALTQPDLVHRLIVADIAPVDYLHNQATNALAMKGLDLMGLTSRAEADTRLAKAIHDPALRAFFLQSLDIRAEGGPRWWLNLDVLIREMPKIIGWPDITGRFDRPALFLRGSRSDYLLPEHHKYIQELFPQAEFATIENAGHWLHAEQPQAFEESVRRFLDS